MRFGWWLVPIVAAGIVIGILAVNGFPHGRDWPYELTRIAEMRAALGAGQWPAFWAPDVYHGFGSPIFVYYAPLFATLSSLCSVVLEIPDAAVAVLCLSVLIAALMMFGAVKEIAGARAAAIASVAFVLQPYLLADIWIRNADAEVMALALLPGVLGGAIAPRPQRRFWWTFLSLSGLILAHNLMALVALAMALTISVFVHRNLRALVPTLVGIIAALAVTSFFWLPAMSLRPLGVRDAALIAGKFDFHQQFPRPAALVLLDLPDEFFSGGYLGVAMLCALVAGAVIMRRRVVAAFALAALVLIVLMLRVSAPVWETVPLMRYLQFPWRLAGPLGLVTIMGFAILIDGVKRSGIAEALFVAMALLNALPLVAIYPRMDRSEMRRFSALLTPEGIRDHGLKATVGDDYLPPGADLRLLGAGREPIAFVSPELSVRVHAAPAGAVSLTVSSTLEGAIGFRRWFYPAFGATIDGTAARLQPMDGGIAGLSISPGRHEVRVAPVEPLIRTITKTVSALALVCIGVIVLLRRRGHFVNTVTSADEPAGT